jgi:hypothetical protein
MKRWTTALLACAATAGLAAASDAGKTVTLTGCVQNISRSNPGAPTEKGFLLANATGEDANSGANQAPSLPPPMPAPLAVGTSGTAAAGMPDSLSYPAATGTFGDQRSSRNSSYVLIGHDSDVKAQVGRKVEVTGTVAPAPQAEKGSSTAAASDAMASGSPRLEVTSIRVMASKCSAK